VSKLPDIETLQLCSLLATFSFGLVFAAVWRTRRRDDYLLFWAAASFLYGAVLIAFALLGSTSAVQAVGLLGLLGVTDVLLLCGLRRFDGLPPWRAWMAVPVLSAMLGQALPFALRDLGGMALDRDTMRIGGALGLTVTVGIVGIWMIRSRPRHCSPDSRWIAGAALLGYIPAYLLSVLGEAGAFPHANLLGLLPMLSDQLLLGVLNLGLLTLPAQRAQAQLREAARRDPLTGVWNRAGLEAEQGRLLSSGASVVAIDVDHFKAINDRHGHGVGDAVLISIAREVGRCAQAAGGELARIGGDEFVVLLPPAPGGAFAFAERVRGLPETAEMGLPGWTLSLGVASVTSDEDSFAPALGRADASLYRAKRHGRGRVAA
jgi:diguanylate cyclase (GGDEF)-like protein